MADVQEVEAAVGEHDAAAARTLVRERGDQRFAVAKEAPIHAHVELDRPGRPGAGVLASAASSSARVQAAVPFSITTTPAAAFASTMASGALQPPAIASAKTAAAVSPAR